MKSKILCISLLVIIFSVVTVIGNVYSSSTTTYRDKHGRTLGKSITTGRNTTHYDKHGRVKGKSTVSNSGKTVTHYDRHGKVVYKTYYR